MKSNAPKKVTLIISICLIIVGLIGHLVPSLPDVINFNSYWITFAGGALLSLGCLLKGL